MALQEVIISASVALVSSSALIAGFYFREYAFLKKQVKELAENYAGGKSEKVKPEIFTELIKQIESCQSRVGELERRKGFSFEAAAAASAPAPTAAPPANANRRSQIMRLHRSGESISSIASALGVSQGEVKLIVKVQEMLAENGNADRSPDFL